MVPSFRLLIGEFLSGIVEEFEFPSSDSTVFLSSPWLYAGVGVEKFFPPVFSFWSFSSSTFSLLGISDMMLSSAAVVGVLDVVV